jgi:hypothetical protein
VAVWSTESSSCARFLWRSDARQARSTEVHQERIKSCLVLFLDYSSDKTSILRIE